MPLVINNHQRIYFTFACVRAHAWRSFLDQPGEPEAEPEPERGVAVARVEVCGADYLVGLPRILGAQRVTPALDLLAVKPYATEQSAPRMAAILLWLAVAVGLAPEHTVTGADAPTELTSAAEGTQCPGGEGW
eukprot:scaffold26783_cov47-Phaeocystis_antarctica.AAC.6